MEASVATIATVKCTRRCYFKGKKIPKLIPAAAAMVASVATIATVKCKRRFNFKRKKFRN